MATAPIVTSTPMATLAVAAGAAVLQRLANAVLTVGSESLRGILSDQPVDLLAGDGRAQARRKVFRCLSVEVDVLSTPLVARTTVQLAGEPWVVHGSPIAARQVGWLVVELAKG